MTKNKLTRIKKINGFYKRGCYSTFWNCLSKIPEEVKDKLPAKDISKLIDAIYFAYEDGYLKGATENA